MGPSRPPSRSAFLRLPLQVALDGSRRSLRWRPDSCGNSERLFRSPLPMPCRDGQQSWTCVIPVRDRKSTRLNSSHGYISYAVFCLKKKKKKHTKDTRYKRIIEKECEMSN